MPIGLRSDKMTLEYFWSFEGGGPSMSSCQWQSFDSSDDMTSAGISQVEHVG
jgi:hypothetical protein